jgi:hypothetical protein
MSNRSSRAGGARHSCPLRAQLPETHNRTGACTPIRRIGPRWPRLRGRVSSWYEDWNRAKYLSRFECWLNRSLWGLLAIALVYALSQHVFLANVPEIFRGGARLVRNAQVGSSFRDGDDIASSDYVLPGERVEIGHSTSLSGDREGRGLNCRAGLGVSSSPGCVSNVPRDGATYVCVAARLTCGDWRVSGAPVMSPRT